MRSFLLLAGLIAPFAASAAEMETHSKIDAVTLFPKSALVSRVAEVELPSGETTLVFKNLPFGLDPASLQVSGQASEGLVLGSVTSRLASAEAKSDDVVEVRLKELHSQRDRLQVTVEAFEAEKAMMLRFSQVGPEKLGPDSKSLEVADWTKAWSALGSGLSKLGEDLRSARMRVDGIDEDILRVEAMRAPSAVRTDFAREVSVETEISAAGKARITLTYRIGGATWRPRYEARLQTGNGAKQPMLEFSRRAAISQTTGEDWNDIELVVSTIRAERGATQPDLQPQRIGFRESPFALAGVAGRPEGKAIGGMAPQRFGVPMEPANALPAPALQEASERPATIDAGAFTASFKIAGRLSLGSDGTVKTVPISTRSLSPDLSITTVPVLDENAYLVSRFANDKETPLLPGEAMLYRDGAYIGSSQIAFVAGGDVFDLSFGADDRVKVTRVPVRRKENEPTWFGQTKTETREFKTSIANLHDFPVKIMLVDAVPFAENTAITVEQLAATTPPTQTAVADKRGVTSWTYEYAAGEKREIRLAYRMKWPADRDVVIEPAPLAAK